MVYLCAVVDEVLQNVALGKTAYNMNNAQRGNDGNLNTYTYSGSSSETNPWWAVDLGVRTSVYQVNFTNSNSYGTYVLMDTRCGIV